MSDGKTAQTASGSAVPRLTSVALVQLSGERRAAGLAPATKYNLDLAYYEEGSTYLYRLTGRGDLTDAEGADYGHVEASVVATFESCGWSTEQIESFGQSTAMRVAYPYVREALATTASRLGFAGVMLPPLEVAAELAQGDVSPDPDVPADPS
ncbi:protein-export chaperone SecB [Actinotalea sp. JY-7876]|uniref:protein-export chaperone SecB n=1 Tax=Actinotalea sp. JY-7876 TaxID=2758442 RepID=UPI0015F3992B|nr:protein-export chaperone SecB [Actinotalea sp. JY-7876]